MANGKGKKDQVKRTPEEWAVINEERRNRNIFALDHLRGRVVQVKSFGGDTFLTIFRQADFLNNEMNRANGQLGGITHEVSGPLNEEFNEILLKMDEWCRKTSKALVKTGLIKRGYIRPDAIKRYYELTQQKQGTLVEESAEIQSNNSADQENLEHTAAPVVEPAES